MEWVGMSRQAGGAVDRRTASYLSRGSVMRMAKDGGWKKAQDSWYGDAICDNLYQLNSLPTNKLALTINSCSLMTIFSDPPIPILLVLPDRLLPGLHKLELDPRE